MVKKGNLILVYSLFSCLTLTAQDDGPEPPPAAVLDNIMYVSITIAILLGYLVFRKNK